MCPSLPLPTGTVGRSCCNYLLSSLLLLVLFQTQSSGSSLKCNFSRGFILLCAHRLPERNRDMDISACHLRLTPASRGTSKFPLLWGTGLPHSSCCWQTQGSEMTPLVPQHHNSAAPWVYPHQAARAWRSRDVSTVGESGGPGKLQFSLASGRKMGVCDWLVPALSTAHEMLTLEIFHSDQRPQLPRCPAHWLSVLTSGPREQLPLNSVRHPRSSQHIYLFCFCALQVWCCRHFDGGSSWRPPPGGYTCIVWTKRQTNGMQRKGWDPLQIRLERTCTLSPPLSQPSWNKLHVGSCPVERPAWQVIERGPWPAAPCEGAGFLRATSQSTQLSCARTPHPEKMLDKKCVPLWSARVWGHLLHSHR